MKICKLTSILCIAFMALVSRQATAATANGGGPIVVVAVYDSLMLASNYITLSGFAATGTTCPQLNGNARLALRLDDYGKQMFQLAIAAKLAGKSIGVGVDDTDKDFNGYCYIRWINVTG